MRAAGSARAQLPSRHKRHLRTLSLDGSLVSGGWEPGALQPRSQAPPCSFDPTGRGVPTCPKPRLVSHLQKSSFPSRCSAGACWSEAPVSIAAGCNSPWMRSSSPFKECQCATFCREEIHVNLPFVPLPPKVAVSRDHSYTSAALKNCGCSLHRLCIFCSFFPSRLPTRTSWWCSLALILKIPYRREP